MFPPNFFVLNLTGIKGRKFDSKGEEGRLIGFNVPLLSYCVITQSGKILESKHVWFLRKENLKFKLDADDEIQFHPEDLQQSQEQVPPIIESTPANDHQENNIDHEDSVEMEENSSDESTLNIKHELTQPNPMSPPVKQSTRILRDPSLIKPPTRYGFHQFNSIESHNVWEDHAEEPPNPLDTTWVFKI